MSEKLRKKDFLLRAQCLLQKIYVEKTNNLYKIQHNCRCWFLVGIINEQNVYRYEKKPKHPFINLKPKKTFIGKARLVIRLKFQVPMMNLVSMELHFF